MHQEVVRLFLSPASLRCNKGTSVFCVEQPGFSLGAPVHGWVLGGSCGWRGSQLGVGQLYTHCVGWPVGDLAPPCTSVSALRLWDSRSSILTALSGVQITPSSSLPVGGVGMAAVLTVVLWSTAEGVILAPSS